MNRAFSLYLDGLRTTAALLVFVSHFAYPRFTEGRYIWIRELNLGSDAVVIFFVLSGLIIAYCAEQKEPTFRSFAFARVTRLLSVALPALVIGFCLDHYGSQMFPAFYANQYYNPIGFGDQMLRGLSFSNEWGFNATRLGTNGPYWSLSYEAAYYAIFAVFFFFREVGRWLILAAMSLLFGLNIMLLLPCWLAGVRLYNWIKNAPTLSRPNAIVLSLLPVAIYTGGLSADVPDVLRQVTFNLLPLDQFYGLRFSDEFIWNFGLATLTALHLVGMHALCQAAGARKMTGSTVVRHAASVSFSLYLLHYPVLQFLKPLISSVGGLLFPDLALLLVTLLICVLFGEVFERTLKQQRTLILHLFSTKAKQPRP